MLEYQHSLETFISPTRMKFEFPQSTRFSIILFFVNLLNAGRPRFTKEQAGIDRPCPQEYRPSQDETTWDTCCWKGQLEKREVGQF